MHHVLSAIRSCRFPAAFLAPAFLSRQPRGTQRRELDLWKPFALGLRVISQTRRFPHQGEQATEKGKRKSKHALPFLSSLSRRERTHVLPRRCAFVSAGRTRLRFVRLRCLFNHLFFLIPIASRSVFLLLSGLLFLARVIVALWCVLPPPLREN